MSVNIIKSCVVFLSCYDFSIRRTTKLKMLFLFISTKAFALLFSADSSLLSSTWNRIARSWNFSSHWSVRTLRVDQYLQKQVSKYHRETLANVLPFKIPSNSSLKLYALTNLNRIQDFAGVLTYFHELGALSEWHTRIFKLVVALSHRFDYCLRTYTQGGY